MKAAQKSLRAGVDYPKTMVQFLDWFHTEQGCREYLEKLRWSQSSLICPECGTISEALHISRARLVCPACKHQATATAGTIFDKTRTDLRAWFVAIWFITSQKHGASALGLQRILGLGSYQTAWAMLHRLRRAMVRPERELLQGRVEVDETYLALTDRYEPLSPIGRKSGTAKVMVVIAVEMLSPKGFGRIRIRQIERPDHANLLSFVQDCVSPAAKLHTDGSATYRIFERHGYKLEQTVHLTSGKAAHETMPGVHRVAALLQRWMMGTHHGAVQPAHLEYYLDEFVFRFNRRTSNSRGLLFYRLLEQAVLTSPVTYDDIVKTGDIEET
jgi:ISXO2-like transposase domain/Transposase zinc-ribbon domain